MWQLAPFERTIQMSNFGLALYTTALTSSSHFLESSVYYTESAATDAFSIRDFERLIEALPRTIPSEGRPKTGC